MNNMDTKLCLSGVTFCLSKATEARQKCDKLNRAVSESYARCACNLLI